MNNKEKIESLCQEKFKNFEVTPPEMAWTNIKTELEKKKQKRRIIPFWWKLTGVAALFVIGFFMGNEFQKTSKSEIPDTKNQVVTKSAISKVEKNNQNSIITASDEENKLQKQNINLQTIAEKITVVSKTTRTKNFKNFKSNPSKSEENEVVFSEKISKLSENKSSKNPEKFDQSTEKEIVFSNQKNTIIQNSISEKVKQFLEITNPIEGFSSIVKEKNNSENQIKTIENQNSISEVIAEIPDSKKEEEKTNKLTALLAQKENEKINKIPSDDTSWQIATHLAPIFFGSTSNDSPVDAKYNSNSKTYEKSTSYGVGVQYKLTKKWKVRTGINKLALELTTNNVAFLENTQSVESLIAVPEITTTQVLVESGALSGEANYMQVNTITNKGSLRQEFGYFEIPMEVSYAIIDKKVKIDIISGLSTLFLDQNTLSLTSQKYNARIGEDNNLNKINISSNIGLGIHYNFYKSFCVNLDSILKYQMNTFSNNPGNFNPYTLGLYSGISYKF